MPDIKTAITAALIGSIITALLSYFVQQMLARSRRKEEEQRLAFVYLVQITGFVAAHEIMKNVIKLLMDTYATNFEAYLEKIGASDKTLDRPHIWCALASAALRQFIVEEGHDVFRAPLLSLRQLSDGLDINKIPLNLLTQMPRDAIVAHNSMLESVGNFETTIKVWESWAKPGGEELISANALYSQWVEISELFANASILREELISKGKVSRTEADKILQTWAKKGSMRIFTSWGIEKKLEKAERCADVIVIQRFAEIKKNSAPINE